MYRNYQKGAENMDDKRAVDRRKAKKTVKADKRKGPRRLVCACGGKIDIKILKADKHKFVCARCGKEQ